jgi:uncharacterized protein YvpB
MGIRKLEMVAVAALTGVFLVCGVTYMDEVRGVTERIYEEITLEMQNVMETKETKVVNHKLAVPAILQKPALPTGCEVTALATVLKYLGFGVDKVTLVENYLPMGEIGETNPNDAFIGTPYEESSYGCYAPVIVETANKYLKDEKSELEAENITGREFASLYNEIEEGNPVIVWTTMYLKPSYEGTTWTIDGDKFTWTAREHCMVLTGYDEDMGVVYVADPLTGNTSYDSALFEERYQEMGSQAVVVR